MSDTIKTPFSSDKGGPPVEKTPYMLGNDKPPVPMFQLNTQTPGQFGPSKFSFDWGWTDWLGLAAILLVVAFVYAAIKALASKIDPLKVMREIRAALSAVLSHKGSRK